jgi:hypothetical protein
MARVRLGYGLLACAALLLSKALAAQNSGTAERHEFVIKNFRTESGVTLPEARIVYGTYGHLNAAKDNAVLLPSHYMANYHGYEWLIGPGRALDASQLFLVATELFGNGRSSSPSNTPEPFHGPRFPVMTIRDNVEAVHRLLNDGGAGISMGCELSEIRRSYCRDIRDGEDLSAWSGAPGRPNRRDYQRCRVSERRLHRSADQGTGGVRYGLDGVALFPGMVASRIMARGG